KCRGGPVLGRPKAAAADQWSDQQIDLLIFFLSAPGAGRYGLGLSLLRYPRDKRRVDLRIQHLGWAGPQAVAGKKLLGRVLRHAGKYRPAARQAGAIRTRQVEGVVADVKEQAEGLGAADHRQSSTIQPQCAPSLLEGSAGRIPQKRLGITRMWRDGRDAARQ